MLLSPEKVAMIGGLKKKSDRRLAKNSLSVEGLTSQLVLCNLVTDFRVFL